MKTAFVSDTTLGLTPQEALQQEIHLLPALIMLDGKAHRDYLEIQPAEVIQALQAGKHLTTSHANPGDYQALYERLLQTYDRVLSVHPSAKLSGFVATGQMIARQFGSRVQVLDSMSVNAGMGYVLEEARRRLAEGVSWEGLEAAITPYRARVRGLVLPATLEYLKRSGRVSGLRFLLGSLLKVLPILEFKDGLAQPVERVRGFHRGLTELAQRFRAAFPSGARVTLAHVENPQAVKELSDLLKSEGVVLEGVRHVGAGVTVHAGPGAVALFAAPLKTAA
ncbi:DegV family protein [uncultured Meiothermus sp.]|jgi:DegV family protein with EDD domain|uniref:DegV family protein n=1 Tax=uncultured Meiothermus sp. TaxID=157471 RepID=UPI00262420E1|nr:DegV family protein [uncultured Meiothermus sp.]